MPDLDTRAEDEATGSEDVGNYVVEPIEYVRATPLPTNELFQEPALVSELVERTRSSIESRTPQQLNKIISQLKADWGDAGHEP
jgi:hypothetical protein